MTLEECLKKITPLSATAMETARKNWDSVAKPLGSLGRLEELVVQLAGITGDANPSIDRKAVVAFCADNGVVAEGVTQSDQSVTALVAQSLARGTSSVCRMAEVAGAEVLPVDIGMAQEVPEPELLRRAVRRGTDNLACGPAMTRAECIAAAEVGIHMAEHCRERGYQLLASGEMGIGNTTTSAAVVSVLLGLPPEEITGRGAGLSTEGLQRKVRAIQRGIQVNRPDPADPLDVLAKVGGLDLAGLTGLFLGGAALRLPVIVDGVISAAAALAAVQLCPAVEPYLIASHQSGEPAAARVLEALSLRPVIHAEMRLGEGTGAVALMPLLDMALAVYREAPTFSDLSMEAYTKQL